MESGSGEKSSGEAPLLPKPSVALSAGLTLKEKVDNFQAQGIANLNQAGREAAVRKAIMNGSALLGHPTLKEHPRTYRVVLEWNEQDQRFYARVSEMSDVSSTETKQA